MPLWAFVWLCGHFLFFSNQLFLLLKKPSPLGGRHQSFEKEAVQASSSRPVTQTGLLCGRIGNLFKGNACYTVTVDYLHPFTFWTLNFNVVSVNHTQQSIAQTPKFLFNGIPCLTLTQHSHTSPGCPSGQQQHPFGLSSTSSGIYLDSIKSIN